MHKLLAVRRLPHDVYLKTANIDIINNGMVKQIKFMLQALRVPPHNAKIRG